MMPAVGHILRFDIPEAFKKTGINPATIEKALKNIGATVQGEIIKELNQTGFKNATGNLQKAIKVDVQPSNGRVLIYADNAVAPYAPYQEKGVHKHQMTYLLKAKRPIPMSFADVKGPIFRKATQKSMDKGKWVHPGYPGKYFFKKGIENAMTKINQHLKFLSFKVVGVEGLGE